MLAAKAMGADTIIMTGEITFEYRVLTDVDFYLKISVNLDWILPRKWVPLMFSWLIMMHK